MRKHIAAGLAVTAAAVLLTPSFAASAQRDVLSFHREELPGGAVLLVKESRALPLVTMRVSLKAGTRQEPPAKAGLANMTARLLIRGTASRSASDIEKLNDLLGGGAQVGAGREFATASVQTLNRDLEKGVRLLADALRRPTFPPEEFKKHLSRTLGRLNRLKDRPGRLADLTFRARLFGAHPYGRQVVGKPETLKRIRREDLVRFHRKWYGMKGAIFVFVGDITPAQARKLVLSHFQGWKAEGGEAPPAPLSPTPRSFTVVKMDSPFSQSTVLLGNRSLSRKHPDFYAARVMNYILGGGGFESRILTNIREKKGLVYSAYSFFASGIETGHWRLMLKTKNKSANQAISEAISEIKRIQKEGVTDRELAEAKAFITGSFATRFQSSNRIADYMLAIERLGFPPDYAERYLRHIRSVTKEQVLRAARKYIRLDQAVLTIVGNMTEVKPKY